MLANIPDAVIVLFIVLAGLALFFLTRGPKQGGGPRSQKWKLGDPPQHYDPGKPEERPTRHEPGKPEGKPDKPKRGEGKGRE